MITERRTFQAKPGAAGRVVAKVKEAEPLLVKYGGPVSRVYTDFYSGRTDRVVWELDHETISALESFEQEVAKDAEALKFFESWFQGLSGLIEGASVELWRRED